MHDGERAIRAFSPQELRALSHCAEAYVRPAIITPAGVGSGVCLVSAVCVEQESRNFVVLYWEAGRLVHRDEGVMKAWRTGNLLRAKRELTRGPLSGFLSRDCWA